MPQTQNQPIPYGQIPGKQSDQKFCYACGVIMHVSASDCPSCGARQSDVGRTPSAISGQAYCRGCGQALHRTAPLCPHCGAPQHDGPAESAGLKKSKVIAALLAFFLGGFGVHKFYLGKIGMGILYLLFCWTMIPAVIAFIEGIVYLSTSDERFRQKYR